MVESEIGFLGILSGKQLQNKWTVSIKMCDLTVIFKVDTGVDYTVIPELLYNDINSQVVLLASTVQYVDQLTHHWMLLAWFKCFFNTNQAQNF